MQFSGIKGKRLDMMPFLGFAWTPLYGWKDFTFLYLLFELGIQEICSFEIFILFHFMFGGPLLNVLRPWCPAEVFDILDILLSDILFLYWKQSLSFVRTHVPEFFTYWKNLQNLKDFLLLLLLSRACGERTQHSQICGQSALSLDL